MKKTISLILVFMMLLPFVVSANTSAEFKIGSKSFDVLTDTVKTNETDVAPYLNESGNVMLPLRALCEAFGCTVSWIHDSSTAEIKNGDVTILATIGQAFAKVDGVETALSAPVMNVSGRTMAPIDLFTQAFGYSAEHLAPLGRVLVYDKPAVMTLNSSAIQYDEFSYYYDILMKNSQDTVSRDVAVQFLTDYLGETLAIYDTAKKGGFGEIISSETIVSELKEQINTYEQAEEKPILPGTYASLILKDKFVETYLVLIRQVTAPSEEATKKAYEESFVTVKHILIPTIDLATGEPYSPVKKAEARKRAEELATKARRGTDFDFLMKYNTADTAGLEAYPDGYTFTYGDMLPNFEKASFALEIGHSSGVVETEVGYHIIKRLPLAEMTEENSSAAALAAQTKSFENHIDHIISNAEIQINKDALDTIK